MTRHNNDLDWMLRAPELLALTRHMSTHELMSRMTVYNGFDYKKTHRLGVYFEQLWQHLTSQCNSLNIISHNLQVIIDKHTFGEFDSLIYDSVLDTHLHCELAVKFYLQVGSGTQLSHWVGPNLRDRFDNKHERLFEHQLALSKNPTIKPWLKAQDIKVDQVKVLTRGRLFYPLDSFMKEQFRFPREVNPQHLKGFWTTWEDFAHLQLSSSIEWYILPKMYWLSPVTGDEVQDLSLLDDRAILIHGHNERYEFQRIQQVVGMREGKEIMRGFVVTDEWLEKAKARVKSSD
ncbi:DUF1853 family protein [Kangiella sp. HD9-110m-PIT-SAG06]|nr:DUF1853 family protein [Kangiella sp. HD9-110m-PIT-SAG06]RDX36810.1 DUF1853 family protein [Kangiella sp. HD9-110m-PIT-SAG07]